jgi:asparagine synthase (glutamine-hydrolysing)
MCGFVGVVGPKLNNFHITKLHAANRRLRHRGPDDEGYVLLRPKALALRGDDTQGELQNLPHIRSCNDFEGVAALANRRLSIVDLSEGGHLPMSDSVTGNWIAYNGEIYNHAEIRQELESLGRTFHSSSDTEVILNAYAQWGNAFLEKLNGMFAFAIWNAKAETVFCARDRFGEKQLYFAFGADRSIWFASEIHPLLGALEGPVPAPRSELVWDFLMYGLADHTEHTFFTGICQLLPGHCVAIESGKIPQQKKWYSLQPTGTHDPDSAVRFRDLLDDSVRLRLRSDVPVASFLSGGLDSSMIVALADRWMHSVNGKPGSLKLRTYTNRYPEGNEFDESELVKKLLTGLRTVDPVFILPDQDVFRRDLMEMVRCQEQPFHNASIFASFSLLRTVGTADRFKVILTGEAGDELLAGYWRAYLPMHLAGMLGNGRIADWAHEAAAWGWIIGLKNTLKGAFRSLPDGTRTLLQRMRSPIPKLMKREFLSAFRERDQLWMDQWRGGSLNQRLIADLTRFNLPQLLRHLDRNSMHFSVEARVPFLDHRLVEFACALPPEQKLQRGYTKHILRQAAVGILPDEIRLSRRKLGFGMAEQLWFSNSLDLLDTARLADFVDVQELSMQIAKGPQQAHWLPVSLGLWLKSFY